MLQNIQRWVTFLVKELMIFGPTLRWGQSFPTPSLKRRNQGECESETFVFQEGFICGVWGSAWSCPAHPILASWLFFFWISRVFSFQISLANSLVSLRYLLKLSSESWFTIKLFILSSKEPTSLSSWGNCCVASSLNSSMLRLTFWPFKGEEGGDHCLNGCL